MKKITFERWCLYVALFIITANVFTIHDYQFYIVSLLIAIGVGNLFGEK